ncbi:IS66 family insertion sequence element accessory protein TnpB [Desulfopila sp. IMCC35008]|uniref:IS66 family insertion sequence element accessory protein TnpB n=1 Tax=Desulfopila sp. IMCC35008 TaxID=2653858 RepID=UPI0013D3B0D3|nr:IS66 family insertion sequence element accessory protein TnpB [Desulfopila sp. IMCC35008]
MIFKPSETKVYIALGATDMRKSINGLSLLVEEQFGLDLFSGSFFAFCNRKRDLVKILYWADNGFCIYVELSINTVMPMI